MERETRLKWFACLGYAHHTDSFPAQLPRTCLHLGVVLFRGDGRRVSNRLNTDFGCCAGT
jgi:hypothetical protein